MARTTKAQVQELLGRDYGAMPSGVLPNLQPYIDSATVIVDRVAACAITKSLDLTGAELELVERWLAAHLYTKSDPIYQSESKGGATATYVADPKIPERYKAGAINVDYSGCLKAILERQFASGMSLGGTTSQRDCYSRWTRG